MFLWERSLYMARRLDIRYQVFLFPLSFGTGVRSNGGNIYPWMSTSRGSREAGSRAINLVALLFDWTYAFVHLIRHLYFVLVSHIPLVLGFSHLKQSWKREKSR